MTRSSAIEEAVRRATFGQLRRYFTFWPPNESDLVWFWHHFPVTAARIRTEFSRMKVTE